MTKMSLMILKELIWLGTRLREAKNKTKIKIRIKTRNLIMTPKNI